MHFSLRAFKKKAADLGKATIRNFSMMKFKRKSSDAKVFTQPRRSPKKLQKKRFKDSTVVYIQRDPYGKSDADSETDSTEIFPFLRLATIEEEDEEALSEHESNVKEDSLLRGTADDIFENYKLIFSDATSSIYSENNMLLLSDVESNIYTGTDKLDFKTARCAISEFNPADNRLSDEQVAEIQDDINFLRSNFMSVENASKEAFVAEEYQQESLRDAIIPAANLSIHRLSRCSTPDTNDSSNEKLSRVSSYFTARTSLSVNDESEISTGRTYTSCVNEAEEVSRKTRSRQSFLSIQTSKWSPVELPELSEKPSLQVKTPEKIPSSKRVSPLSFELEFLLEKLLPIPGSFPVDKTIVSIPIETPEEVNSSYSQTSASLSSLRGCSSTEELPSSASFSTTQTTSVQEPDTMPQPSRRPFSLDEAIEIDDYCENRKAGIARGQLWMDKFWGFESLQLLFVWKYGWKPDIERFEDFWLRRQEQSDFWLLWDYPTSFI